MSDISKSINKVDNEEKITGKAIYIDDVKVEGMLYAKTFRSSISKGRIVGRSYPELPEGYFIIDYSDIKGNNYIDIISDDWPIFAEDSVNHIGEPILLVVGEDKEIILELMENIEIEFEEEKPNFLYTDSIVHYDFIKGEGEAVFENAFRIINHTYTTGYQEQLYIEPQGIIGTYEEGRIVIRGSMQCPYYIKNALINTLGCNEGYVRVIQTTTGGGFGGKEEFPSLLACQVAVAVEKIKRPVKLIYDRKEDISSSTKRHPSRIYMEAAIDKEQNILGLRVHVSLNGGAFEGLSSVVLQRAMTSVSGVYSIPNLSVSGDVYRTNTVTTGAFRGFGAPQAFFAIEMFMEHVSEELGLDPLELKKKYLAKQGELTSTSGRFRDSIIMEKMAERVMKISNYEKKLKEYKKEKFGRGIGMSWFLHGCGFTGSGEKDLIKAVVGLKKSRDNIVTVLAASVDMGQGVKTTFRKLVSKILEVPLEQVRYENPDTDLVPDSGPTVASRTIMIVGGLLARAAEKLRKKWLDGEEQSVEERYKQPEYIQWNQEKLQGDAYPAYSWGVNVVEVEVDPETYEVKVVGVWAVYDIGKAIDEKIVLGQMDGGLLQGISYGYLEVMDTKEGRIYQNSLTDYSIPTAMDTNNVVIELMDNPYALGPYGAKGAGELPLVGGAPAVALAIENSIGRKITKIPVSSEYIMELMEDE